MKRHLQDELIEVLTNNNCYGAIVDGRNRLGLNVGLQVASEVVANKLLDVLHCYYKKSR